MWHNIIHFASLESQFLFWKIFYFHNALLNYFWLALFPLAKKRRKGNNLMIITLKMMLVQNMSHIQIYKHIYSDHVTYNLKVLLSTNVTSIYLQKNSLQWICTKMYNLQSQKITMCFQRYKTSEIASVHEGLAMRNRLQEMDCHVLPC